MDGPRFQLEEVASVEFRSLGPSRAVLEGRRSVEELPIDVAVPVMVPP